MDPSRKLPGHMVRSCSTPALACWEVGGGAGCKNVSPVCGLLTQGLPSFLCLDLVTQRHQWAACKETSFLPKHGILTGNSLDFCLCLIYPCFFENYSILSLLPLEFLRRTECLYRLTLLTSRKLPEVVCRGALLPADILNRTCCRTWLPSWSHCAFIWLDPEALCSAAPLIFPPFHSSEFPAPLGFSSSSTSAKKHGSIDL